MSAPKRVKNFEKRFERRVQALARSIRDEVLRSIESQGRKWSAEIRREAVVQADKFAKEVLSDMRRSVSLYKRIGMPRFRAFDPSAVIREHEVKMAQLVEKLKAKADMRVARYHAVARTIIEKTSYQVSANLKAETAMIRYQPTAPAGMPLMTEEEMSKAHRGAYGLTFTFDSPFYGWSTAKTLLEQGYTPDLGRFHAGQAKSFLLDFYSELYAQTINLFFTTYYDFVNPQTGRAVKSHRLMNALAVQFGPTINDMHIGLYGNRYLQWVAKTLEEGGTIVAKRKAFLTLPNYRFVKKVHRPPWRRAKLHRTAKIIPMRTKRGIWPVIARKRGRDLEVLYWARGMRKAQWEGKGKVHGPIDPRALADANPVKIAPKRFWRRTVQRFSGKFQALVVRPLPGFAFKQWSDWVARNRKVVTYRIPDLLDPRISARRLSHAPPSRIVLYGRGAGRPPTWFIHASAHFVNVRTLITPRQIKPVLRRLLG